MNDLNLQFNNPPFLNCKCFLHGVQTTRAQYADIELSMLSQEEMIEAESLVCAARRILAEDSRHEGAK